ncbi:MAG TPA: hypothetical protein VD971_05280 [Phycisphaerales bacterium]|nr:hypothetical protein [Phycisphaerales bacterium]
MRSFLLGAGGVLGLAVAAGAASGQCWEPGIGTPGLNGDANASVVWDPDGAGPMHGELVVGGGFTTAGGVTVNRIARWNGASWVGFGMGMSGSVFALTVGPGGDLVAGGSFTTAGGVTVNRIARWNGTAWSGFGTGMNDIVNAVTVDDSGDLIAGGRFSTAGGTPVNRIARWDGSAWQPLGGGVGGTPPFYIVSLHSEVNGDLYAGGFFSTAGGAPANNIARWDGASWSPMGSGINGVVNAITNHNGDIVAGGQFTNPGPIIQNYVARWTGTSWTNLGSGLGPVPGSFVWTMTTTSQGDLVVGGTFSTAGGQPANYIAMWDGVSWAPLGSGTSGFVRTITNMVNARLAVGGAFTTAGGAPASRIAQYAYGDVDPVVSLDPESEAACPGVPAVFTVGAFGGEPLAYQWQWQESAGPVWNNLTEGANAAAGGTIIAAGTQTDTLTLTTDGPGARLRAVVSNFCGSDTSAEAELTIGGGCCDSIDFNGDGLFPDNQDLEDFFSVFGGGPCSTGTCGDIDFNNDGLFPDNIDLEAMLSVFGGGAC